MIGVVVQGCADVGIPIVVDDGSTDSTAAVAAAAGAEVVRHDVNRGYDAALESGFARAAADGCEVAITIDADGQHDPAVLTRLLAAIDEGADVVVGIRDRHQRLAESIFSLIGRVLYRIEDPLCGLKAYRLAVYRDLGHFDCYRSTGTELAIFAARAGYRIAQIPIRTRERVGAPRFGNRLSGNLKIFRSLILGMTRRHSGSAAR